MNFDELQNSWEALDQQAQAHPSLGNEQLRKQLQKHYRRTLGRILWPEWLALLICGYFAALFVYQFSTFDQLFLQVVASITIGLLIAFPVLRLWLLHALLGVKLTQPLEAVEPIFRNRKQRFQRLQMLNGGLGFLLVIAVMVLTTKVYNEFEVVSGKTFWSITYFLAFGVVMALEYLLKRRYQRILAQAENILHSLQS